MKILLINSFSLGKLIVPVNVLSLASVLKKENYDVSILDYNYASQAGSLSIKENNIDEDLDAMTNLALSYGADLIGLNCICSSYHIFLELAKRIKIKNPNVKLFLGGPQASITAEATLKACPFVELIGIGECERNICSIVDYLSGKIEPDNIPGITYRKNGQIVHNPEEALILNFEELPKLNYDLIPYMDKLVEADIEGGRGCPFSCKFCSTKTFWKRKFRLKELNIIINEIKELKEKYGIRHYNFIHDLFTANKSKILKFCDLLIENNLNIIWTCNSRLDTIDEEIMIKLKEAGCYLVFFGIETGSPRMQKLVSKNLDLTELLPKIKMLQKHDIRPVLSFIYGFPEETIEDVKATLGVIRQLEKLNVKVIQIHRFTVLSGTEYYYSYKDELKFKSNKKSMTGMFNQLPDESFIKNNPELFPHFHVVEGYPEYLESLDKFVCLFCFEIRKYFKNTYDTLLEYFNEDLLQLYLNLLSFDKEIFNELDNYFLSNKVIIEKTYVRLGQDVCIPKFKEYIRQSDFGEKTELIREILNYEADRMDYYYLKSDEPIVKRYMYNVIDICIKNQNKQIAKYDPTTVEFLRDGRRVIAKRIAN